MPGSSQAGKAEAVELLLPLADEIHSILDVGPGAGQWYDLLHPWFPGVPIDAVEIFHKYVTRYNLDRKYRHIYIEDIRDPRKYYQADLIIFGDVLEHMTHSEAEKVVDQHLQKWAVVSMPIGECPQEGTEENPYEAHVSTWSVEDVLKRFPVKGRFFLQAMQWINVEDSPAPKQGVFLLEKQ